MLSIRPEPAPLRATLFPYLRPCQPAPGITSPDITSSNVATATASTDLLNRPARLSPRRKRWLSLGFGAVHAAALAMSIWLLTLPQAQPDTPVAVSKTLKQQAQADLWQTLGSTALAETLLAAKVEQTEQALTAANQDRLQAQQLRLNAEAKARSLTDRAAEQAGQQVAQSVYYARLIAAEGSYFGAEQLLFPNEGDSITLKFDARIQCQSDELGETAVAKPIDTRIASREVRNLALCHPSALTLAGQPIGEAGDIGVAFFKLE